MTERIQRDLLLAFPPVDVWQALTDPERLEQWLADEVRIDRSVPRAAERAFAPSTDEPCDPGSRGSDPAADYRTRRGNPSG